MTALELNQQAEPEVTPARAVPVEDPCRANWAEKLIYGFKK